VNPRKTVSVSTILGTFTQTIPDPAFDDDFSLCVACLPAMVGAYRQDDGQIIVFYRGELNRIGIGGFAISKEDFIRAASGTYEQVCDFFYPSNYELGLD